MINKYGVLNSLLAAAALALAASTAAHANGITKGEAVAAQVAQALGSATVTCANADDRVTLDVDKDGKLRMFAHYSGSISGDVDTDDEGSGEECGGMTAQINAKYSTFVLDDDYNDCERGWWGYRIMLPETSLKIMREHEGKFLANSYATDQGSRDGVVRNLVCEVSR